MTVSVRSFAFCVLAYNHQDYIVEHLESIKYLIDTYGQGIDIQLVFNDDCSKDRTVALAEAWLADNAGLFCSVTRLYNESNLGTCRSFCNIVNALNSQYCKITAGDDVYSFENLFEGAPQLARADIVSGIPLDLTDGVISKRNSDVFHMVASSLVYEGDTLLNRFKGISVNNAPNIFYGAQHLKNVAVQQFVGGFDVVEDWPLQIAIAESSENARFELLNKVFVYYRRTPGSTYIVASSRFCKDHQKVYDYLIGKETSTFSRLVLKNRLLCFKSNSKFIKRLCNLAVLSYGLKCILKMPMIRRRVAEFTPDVARHARHYSAMKNAAQRFQMTVSVAEQLPQLRNLEKH